MQESTEWHRVVMYSKLAEIVGQYVQKGKLIYIEGRIRTNKWQDQSGQDRYTTEIIANEMQLLGGNGGRDEGGDGFNQDAAPSAASTKARPSAKGDAAAPPADLDKFEDDDIPF
ncbi:MAG: single-stranded DNA-binding protein [Gammaproteobacteria bacterium]|nr:single-stranded DNA-binding protein [Gammaproteobacteria bacterium]